MDELLEVFFALMMLFELEPTRVGDTWQVSSEVDPIHDTRSAFAMRLELPGPWQEDGRERLLVLRCEEGRPGERPGIQAWIVWNLTPEALSGGGSDLPVSAPARMDLLTRFGDEAPQRLAYRSVRFGDVIAAGPQDMDAFLSDVARAPRLALRREATPGVAEQTTVFDLTGSARLLAHFAAGCGIGGEAAVPGRADTPESSPTPLTSETPEQRFTRARIYGLIQRQVQANWRRPPALQAVDDMAVILEFQLQPDGTIHDLQIPETELDRVDRNPLLRPLLDSAQAAILRTSKITGLPPEDYGLWRRVRLNFRPQVSEAVAAPRSEPLPPETVTARAAREAGVAEAYYVRLRGLISTIAARSYPRRSLDLGEEGTVVMLIRVREDGSVIDIAIQEEHTDASPRLQRAAQRAVLRAAPFEPLPEGAGVKLIPLPVVYRIAER